MRFRLVAPVVTLIATLAMMLGVAQAADEGHQHGSAKAQRQELGSSAAFAPDGTLYVASKRGDYVVVDRSSDLGKTWNPVITVNREPEAISADGENRPKLAIAQDGGILVSWTKPLKKPYTGEIRFARSADGKTFDAPITVHRDKAEITHRFESLAVTRDGRVLVAWIDKRDLEAAKANKTAYRGAAIYAAVSSDHGRSFQPEQKVADYSCECCRIAIAEDNDGSPLLLWRQVYAPNERDHALAKLRADGTAASVQRATYDRWKIDACPHHGPGLTVDDKGIMHAVWFNFRDGEGRVFYGRLLNKGTELVVDGQRPVGGKRAEHADIASSGQRIAVIWKEFDGEKSRLSVMLSEDGGRNFKEQVLDATEGASDQPHVLRRNQQLVAIWRTEREGIKLYPLP